MGDAPDSRTVTADGAAVLSMIDALRARGVAQFSGLGFRVTLYPPADGAPVAAPPPPPVPQAGERIDESDDPEAVENARLRARMSEMAAAARAVADTPGVPSSPLWTRALTGHWPSAKDAPSAPDEAPEGGQ